MSTLASFSGSVLVPQVDMLQVASLETPMALRKNLRVPEEACGMSGVTSVPPMVVGPLV